MEKLNMKGMTIKRLDHLGLVTAAIEELELVEMIDQQIPKTKAHTVSVGESVKAMILIGLGYTDRPLYMVAQYLEHVSMERLFKEGLKAEDFTDDVLGRALDKIYEADPTGLFIRLINQMKQKITKGKRQLLHFDTTTFSVYGEYVPSDSEETGEEEETRLITIEHGYPKNGRFDLKQFILSLCVNNDGIPLMMEAVSGSESDKNTIIATMKKLRENISLDKEALYIADSSFFTKKNIEQMGEQNKFLTRAPGTVKVVKELERAEYDFEKTTNPNYHYKEVEGEYAGVRIKYIVVHSREMQAMKEKSVDRRLKKEKEKAAKSLKKVCNHTWYCEADARAALEKWGKDNPLFTMNDIIYTPQTVKINGKRGRPKATDATTTHYRITTTLEYNPEAVEAYTHNLGRFVLATNDLSLTGEEALTLYKKQSRVERGFRFLKDSTFRVSQILLKKTERIQALLMIMVLTLFVYNYLERELRNRIKEQNETVENFVKKQITNPTMKMIFVRFQGISTITLPTKAGILEQIEDLDHRQVHILDILGETYSAVYA